MMGAKFGVGWWIFWKNSHIVEGMGDLLIFGKFFHVVGFEIDVVEKYV